jgi:hypothetical protein
LADEVATVNNNAVLEIGVVVVAVTKLDADGVPY